MQIQCSQLAKQLACLSSAMHLCRADTSQDHSRALHGLHSGSCQRLATQNR